MESILAEPDDTSSICETEDDIINLSLEKLTTTSETLSIGSLLSLSSPSRPKIRQTSTSGVIFRHLNLKGICTQIASASVSLTSYETISLIFN